MEAATRHDVVRVDLRGPVAVVTISRAAKANALAMEHKQALATAVEATAGRDDVKAVVLTGEGGRSFCAGSDLAEMQGFDAAGMHAMLAAERAMYLAVLRAPKPVAAAVRGYALGAGLNLVLCCDYAVGSTDARFAAPELTLGVTDPLEGLLLPWVVGLGHARSLYYTGRRLDADEALRLGVLHEVVDPDRCLDQGVQVAQRLGELPGTGFAVHKRLLHRLVSSGNLDAVIAESHLETSLQFASRETPESIARFLARRG